MEAARARFVKRRVGIEGSSVTISVRDAQVSGADRIWIEAVCRDYLDDLAPLNTGIFPVLGEVGHREPDQVAHWFADPAAHPLVIAQSSRLVGFALVVRDSTEGMASAVGARSRAATRSPSYRMAEFFIARPDRGRGIGRDAARLIFDRFAGRWEIIEYLRNPDAVRFWRRVVATYTQGRFDERVVNGEVRQTFESARKPNA
jgi:predicted acetyltransferase